MAITQSVPPAGGQQTISAALARRLPRAATLSPLGGAPATGAPLPLYNVGLRDAESPDPIEHARLVGWRYPVVGGPEPGLAHLAVEANGNEYQGLTHGYLAQRLVDAAGVAEEAVGNSPAPYEARLLQIPALRIFALWLAGPDNRFVLITDGHAPRLDSPPAIVDDLKPVIDAAHQPEAPPPPPGPDVGPSNAE